MTYVKLPFAPLCRRLTFVVYFLIAGCAVCCAHTLQVADRTYIGFPELIADLAAVQVVFVGELHDNAGHHRAQLQIIRALRERGDRVAIGLEMFRSDHQQYLDQWVTGKISLDNFLPVYQDNWSYWDVYKDIFFYARQNAVPMIGLNLPRQIVRKVARQGFASLQAHELENLPVVSCIVDPAYEQFIRRALGTHQGSRANFLNFCEAQLLWDKVMAQNLSSYIAANPGTTVVVLAGNGHSWKPGIPRQLEKLATGVSYRVLLPELPGRIQAGAVSAADCDYLLLGTEGAPLH